MIDRPQLTQVLDQELRNLRASPPFDATEDIDMVWAVSAPGTVKQEANDGAYSGKSFDALVVNQAVNVVRQVTARRLGKSVLEVTKDDVGAHGPLLYYNGEHTGIPHMYRQNEDLAELVAEPSFPIPSSKVVISAIDQMNTPAQVRDLAGYLRSHPGEVGRIAVVCLGAHSLRVGRYIELNKALIPEGIRLVRAAVPLEHDTDATIDREVGKVWQYLQAGHLAVKSYFEQ